MRLRLQAVGYIELIKKNQVSVGSFLFTTMKQG